MELMVVNPKGKRRPRRKDGRFVKMKGGGARKGTTKKRRRSRPRRNPSNLFRRSSGGGRDMKLFGIDVGAAAIGAAGVVGSEIATGFVASAVPVDALKTGYGRLALKAATVIGLGYGARVLLGARISSLVVMGGAIGVALDAWNTLAAGMAPAGAPAGVGRYELGRYELTPGERSLPDRVVEVYDSRANLADWGTYAPAWGNDQP